MEQTLVVEREGEMKGEPNSRAAKFVNAITLSCGVDGRDGISNQRALILVLWEERFLEVQM